MFRSLIRAAPLARRALSTAAAAVPRFVPRAKLAAAAVVGTVAAGTVAFAACAEEPKEYFIENDDGTFEYGYVVDGVQYVCKYDKDMAMTSDGPASSEGAAPRNSAFVFVKPHAVTAATKALVAKQLEAKGLTILTDGSLTSETIDEKKLIDQHYYAIASKATILTPDQLNVPADKFKAQFGLDWTDALATGRVMNAMDGCKALDLDAAGLDAEWAKAKKAKKLVKFGGGFYCGLIEVEGKAPHWIFNGFFMSMRSKFTAPGGSISYYVVEWPEADCSWSDFRGKVLGPTDPADAPADSLRGQILVDWKALGLKSEPNVGDNGVHASASPFEALAERNNWLSVPIASDPFGAALIAAGVPETTIAAWSVDPQVMVDGKKGSFFDAVEDLDAAACIKKCVAIAQENGVASVLPADEQAALDGIAAQVDVIAKSV